jgi:hypothetical protein
MDEKLFHTVYLSFDENPKPRKYVGKHSTDDPYDDYYGSFHDKTFKPVGKIILGYYKSPQGATQGEIIWQRSLNVVEDPQYVNRAYQTSKGFDTTGREREYEEVAPGGRAMKGLLSWTDGVSEKRSKECPGEGWTRGKPLMSDQTKEQIGLTVSDLKWWRKGNETKRSVECPGDGWEEGRGEFSANVELCQCTITGHITTPGPLSRWQKARGIDHKDPNNRRRVS